MQSNGEKKTAPSWPHAVVAGAMIVASGLAIALAPTRYAVPDGAVNLEQMIPKEFSGWRQVETGMIQMDLAPRDGEERTINQPYDQALMRTYVGGGGQVVMLALAYGRTQRQEVKIHRPELCYISQGFEVRDRRLVTIDLGEETELMAYRLLTRSQQRIEPLTYWIRIGDRVAKNPWESRGQIFKEGLQGNIPDGILVRVSSISRDLGDVDRAYELQTKFLAALWTQLPPEARKILVPAQR